MVSLWTTAAGRLHLYGLMRQVEDTPGCRLLYTDTDSLIFVHPRGKNPLPTGGHFGQLSNECPRHNILEYCSGGPKQYGLRLAPKGLEHHPPTPEDYKHQLKIKAFTLNYDATVLQGMQYRYFRNTVYRYTKTGHARSKRIVQRRQFQPLVERGEVWSRDTFKTQRPYFCKGIVVSEGFRVLDYGYNPDFDNK